MTKVCQAQSAIAVKKADPGRRKATKLTGRHSRTAHRRGGGNAGADTGKAQPPLNTVQSRSQSRPVPSAQRAFRRWLALWGAILQAIASDTQARNRTAHSAGTPEHS